MTAVQTDGLGKPTTKHLNLKRTLADVWGCKPVPVAPPPEPRRPRYAGYDPTEVQVKSIVKAQQAVL